jgi:hypothetical protein
MAILCWAAKNSLRGTVHRAEKNRVEKIRCIRRIRRLWGGPLDIISSSSLFILQPVLCSFFIKLSPNTLKVIF